jgi:hypothetical protein
MSGMPTNRRGSYIHRAKAKELEEVLQGAAGSAVG